MRETRKCLITGGAGFIGSHLCDRLIQQGFTVFCIDNLVTGRKKNISHLLKNPNFVFFRHDVSCPFPSKIFKKLKGVGYIYHLASPASPPKYRQFAIETMLVNSQGTKNLLDLALETKAIFLFTSTSEVYGDPKEHPQKEDYFGNVNPVGPRSCYDESKRFGEAITMEYVRKYEIDARIVRIFNTYGPRMQADDGRVISNFVNQAIRGKPVTIYGDGEQTRSFCYVSDMVEGIILASQKDKARAQVINLGFPQEHTINEIYEKVSDMVPSCRGRKNSPLPQDDPVRRKPDISKAKKILGWQPTVSLEEGLKNTIEYFSLL